MEDVKFHQCVRLSRFESDRTISFIPPDGEFELMSYRLSTPIKPLIWAEASVESHRGSRVEYTVKVRGQFKRRSTANNVEIIIPVPDDCDSPRFRTPVGSVVYAPEKSAFVWKIKQLGGGRDYMMRAHFGLPSVRNGELLRFPSVAVAHGQRRWIRNGQSWSITKSHTSPSPVFRYVSRSVHYLRVRLMARFVTSRSLTNRATARCLG